MELQVQMLLLDSATMCEHEGCLIKNVLNICYFMTIFLEIRSKHEKNSETAGCILSTSQQAVTSKCTLRLKISIHQLKNNHCTRILIANLLLTSIRLLFIPHAEQKIPISIPRVSFKVTSKICLLEWSAVIKAILLV